MRRGLRGGGRRAGPRAPPGGASGQGQDGGREQPADDGGVEQDREGEADADDLQHHQVRRGQRGHDDGQGERGPGEQARGAVQAADHGGRGVGDPFVLLADAGEEEDLVIHGQAEGDAEDERGHEHVRGAGDGEAAQQARSVAFLEDEDQGAETGCQAQGVEQQCREGHDRSPRQGQGQGQERGSGDCQTPGQAGEERSLDVVEDCAGAADEYGCGGGQVAQGPGEVAVGGGVGLAGGRDRQPGAVGRGVGGCRGACGRRAGAASVGAGGRFDPCHALLEGDAPGVGVEVGGVPPGVEVRQHHGGRGDHGAEAVVVAQHRTGFGDGGGGGLDPVVEETDLYAREGSGERQQHDGDADGHESRPPLGGQGQAPPPSQSGGPAPGVRAGTAASAGEHARPVDAGPQDREEGREDDQAGQGREGGDRDAAVGDGAQDGVREDEQRGQGQDDRARGEQHGTARGPQCRAQGGAGFGAGRGLLPVAGEQEEAVVDGEGETERGGDVGRAHRHLGAEGEQPQDGLGSQYGQHADGNGQEGGHRRSEHHEQQQRGQRQGQHFGAELVPLGQPQGFGAGGGLTGDLDLQRAVAPGHPRYEPSGRRRRLPLASAQPHQYQGAAPVRRAQRRRPGLPVGDHPGDGPVGAQAPYQFVALGGRGALLDRPDGAGHAGDEYEVGRGGGETFLQQPVGTGGLGRRGHDPARRQPAVHRRAEPGTGRRQPGGQRQNGPCGPAPGTAHRRDSPFAGRAASLPPLAPCVDRGRARQHIATSSDERPAAPNAGT